LTYSVWGAMLDAYCKLKGPWSPKLTYTFYPFSWKCRILW